jgi:hypothetical protein
MADPKVVEQEFVVRVPQREENKKYHVMKFRASPNQDFSKWTGSRMVRENNQKIVQSNVPQDDDPKFGAGSVFGQDMKEELRLKKLGGKITTQTPSRGSSCINALSVCPEKSIKMKSVALTHFTDAHLRSQILAKSFSVPSHELRICCQGSSSASSSFGNSPWSNRKVSTGSGKLSGFLC